MHDVFQTLPAAFALDRFYNNKIHYSIAKYLEIGRHTVKGHNSNN